MSCFLHLSPLDQNPFIRNQFYLPGRKIIFYTITHVEKTQFQAPTKTLYNTVVMIGVLFPNSVSQLDRSEADIPVHRLAPLEN